MKHEKDLHWQSELKNCRTNFFLGIAGPPFCRGARGSLPPCPPPPPPLNGTVWLPLTIKAGLLSWTLSSSVCNRFGLWKYSPVHERRLWILFHMQIHLTVYILLLELPKTCPSLPYVSLSISISPAANGGFAVFKL